MSPRVGAAAHLPTFVNRMSCLLEGHSTSFNGVFGIPKRDIPFSFNMYEIAKKFSNHVYV
jgi:hypothetical protein